MWGLESLPKSTKSHLQGAASFFFVEDFFPPEYCGWRDLGLNLNIKCNQMYIILHHFQF